MNSGRRNMILTLSALVLSVIALVLSVYATGLFGGTSLAGAAGAGGAQSSIMLSCATPPNFKGNFTSVTGIGSTSEVVAQKVAGERGVQLTLSIPGRVEFQPVVLQRGLTDDKAASEWRKQVLTGQANAARANCEVSLVDARGAVMAKWALSNAWPSEYSVDTLTKDGEAIPPVETLTIVYDNMERVK